MTFEDIASDLRVAGRLGTADGEADSDNKHDCDQAEIGFSLHEDLLVVLTLYTYFRCDESVNYYKFAHRSAFGNGATGTTRMGSSTWASVNEFVVEDVGCQQRTFLAAFAGTFVLQADNPSLAEH